MPFLVSLTKHNSDPPIWWVYFDSSKKMQVSTEDLQNTRGFQRRAMEQLNLVTPVIKQDEWTRILQELMERVEIIEVPESASVFGTMKFYILDWLATIPHDDNIKELLGRKNALIDGKFIFLLSPLVEHLMKKSFALARPEIITSTLTQMGATFKTIEIGSTTRSVYLLDANQVHGHKDELPVPDMGKPIAY
jgi:hypothetical protein